MPLSVIVKTFNQLFRNTLVCCCAAGMLASANTQANERDGAPQSLPKQTIRVPAQVFEDNSVYAYFVAVLKLALNKTAEEGIPYKIMPDPFNANQDRLLRQLTEGTTDITWAVTSVEREQANRAIYFPLARGLLGYRIFLVHPDNKDAFVNKPAWELKKEVAVQGLGWPDTDVLRFNGFRVEEVPITMMFKLIETKMADYFPRSVMEIEYELQSRPSANLMVESSKGFYYPSPMYFFVNKQNQRLASRLQKGLDMALQVGSLLALYEQQSFAISANKMLLNRDIIDLKNPVLSTQSKQTLEKYSAFVIKH